MSTMIEPPLHAGLGHELNTLRGEWPWFVFLGVALVALGAVALSSMAFASLATALAIGVLLLLGGTADAIGAFWCRRWSGFFVHLLSGVLSAVIGVMFLRAPLNALATLTLLVAAFLMTGGVFKIIAAVSHRFALWGWPLVSGIIDVILGVMIWREWPASALWVIGLFMGINLVFRGVNWIGLGLSLRGLPQATRR